MNPFSLELDSATGDYVLDFAPIFEGIFSPVIARFSNDEHGFTPKSITIGSPVPLLPSTRMLSGLMSRCTTPF